MIEINERLISQLKKHEDLSLTPYVCSEGYLTIGVGRNLDTRGITEEEANALLQNDIKECYDDLIKNLPFFFCFTDNRKIALVDMRFNLGHKGFFSFKKMIKALSKRHFQEAASEMMDSKWFHQVNDRAKTLIDMVKNG